MNGMLRRMIFGTIGLMLAPVLGGCGQEEVFTEALQSVALPTPEENVEYVEEPASFLWDCAFHFAYDSLSDTEKIWYTDIADSLGRMGKSTKLSKAGLDANMDEEDVDRIFQCVLMDHPEIFYVDGYTYTKYNRGDEVVSIEFTGTCNMVWEEAEKRQQQIEKAVTPILSELNRMTEDYDKIKYVYETIIYHTDYDLDASDNQNIYSVFVNGESVCQGYAKAVQYLLNRSGVECVLVQGSVDTGEGHAWNLVRSDGSYYYVDATWGDASYQPESEADLAFDYIPDINYDYLCITTKQLLRTHRIESYVPLPDCIDYKDNYYVREGALFSSYDQTQMQELFTHSFEQGKKEVTFKCTDRECFDEIYAALIERQEVFRFLDKERESVSYTRNEKQLSMTFWVTNG